MAETTTTTTSRTRPYNALFITIFTIFVLAGSWFMRIETAILEIPNNFVERVEIKALESGATLKTQYTGIVSIDTSLSYLVAAFIAGPSGFDAGVRLQQIHFLVSFFSVVCIWNVEACRKRNAGSAISVMIPWTILYQTVGGAVIIPLYYLFHVYTFRHDTYYSSGREISPLYINTILPAAILGYLVPTLAMYVPWFDDNTTQNLTALWQVAPLLVNVLMWIFAFISPSASISKTTSTSIKTRRTTNLTPIYATALFISVVVHVTTLAVCTLSNDPKLSLSNVFIPNRATVKESMTLGLHWIFQWDFLGIFASGLVWCWLAIWDVKRLSGKGWGGAQAAVVIAVGSIVVGPGAVMAGTWWWREGILENLENITAVKGGKTKQKTG